MMIDFANDPIVFGDLTFDSATDDLLVETSSVAVVVSEVREMFEMTVADDIDYPEIFSRQRATMNSSEFSDQAARIRDAERILNLHPAIYGKSVDVKLSESGKLIVSFSLKTGEKLTGITL